jgi:transmembrane protein DUF3566
MTQPARNGQSAPTSTEFDADTSPHPTSTSINDAFGSNTPPPPSPSTPTSSTPWGSTSTTSSSGGQQSGHEPVFTSTPLNPNAAPSEATTASVPLVQGALAPGARPAEAQAEPGARHSDPQGANSRPLRARGPRRARLQLRHIDPWTVLKFSCVLSIALFFVWLIVIGVLFGVLDGAGAIDKINSAVTTLQAGNAKPPITAGIVFGGAAIIGVVNIVLFIALSTVGSVVYNLCADLVGGIEVTLSER